MKVLQWLWSTWGRLLRAIPGTSWFASRWGKMGAWLRKNKVHVTFWLVLGVLVACVLACSSVHTPGPVNVPDSTPAVGTAIDKGKAHVESADTLVKRAVPEANATGKALLGVATDEHGKAITELDTANVELAAVQTERGELVTAIGERDVAIMDRDDQIAAIKAGWGYRLQRFVAWAWFWIKVYLGLYLVLNLVAPFIPGFWGGLLAKVGSWINPFAIVQEVRRLIWKTWMKPADTQGVTTFAPVPATPSTTVPVTINMQLPPAAARTTAPEDIVAEAHKA